MPRLYVVDTNVVVSGVLSFGRSSAPALIVGGMIDGRVPFLLSADLLAEYRRVLLRRAIAARHGLEAAQVDSLAAALTMYGYLRQPADVSETMASEEPVEPAGSGDDASNLPGGPAHVLDDPVDLPDGPADQIPRWPAGDEHICRLLDHEPWSVLVSGNSELIQAVRGWRQTLSPAEAARELGLGPGRHG